jgi:hypothetical protein
VKVSDTTGDRSLSSGCPVLTREYTFAGFDAGTFADADSIWHQLIAC